MAEAADSTTLFHPNIPDLTRERSDQAEIEAHEKAGWLLEDPKVAAEKKAEEAADEQRRSEAARKGAETRKKNAERSTPDASTSDAAVVTIVDDAKQ